MDRRGEGDQDAIVLAETVSFTEEEMLVILLVILGILAAHVVVAGLGCFWAWRAGRGSQKGLVGFVLVAAVESLYVLGALSTVVQGEPNLYLGWVAVPALAQIGLYIAGRRTRAAAR